MNKLHTLLIFTLLNFVAYGDFIDVSSLVSYDGEVKYYDLDRNIIIDRAPTARTDLSCVSVLLDSKQIQPERSYYKIESPVASDIPANVEGRTAFVENNEKLNQFLDHVRFSTKDINTLSAIRVIMYHIVDNPVGCALISRILDKIGDKKILFNIGFFAFQYVISKNDLYEIQIPKIEFDGNTAKANNQLSFGFKEAKKGEDVYEYETETTTAKTPIRFAAHGRPFYLGLVHELIHLMHSLENKATGENSPNKLDHDKYGGEDFWGLYDDLYTIWGVRSVKNRTSEDSVPDHVSELMFRILDNIPIRVFYETETDFGGLNLETNIEIQTFETQDGDIIEPLTLLKQILTDLNKEKTITISK